MTAEIVEPTTEERVALALEEIATQLATLALCVQEQDGGGHALAIVNVTEFE